MDNSLDSEEFKLIKNKNKNKINNINETEIIVDNDDNLKTNRK